MPSAGGASAPRKRETISSRRARNGRCSKRCVGRRCRRRREGGGAAGRSGTYLATKGAERQCWTSSPLRMWEGWCRRWMRKTTPELRCLSGSSGSGGSGKRSGGERRRRWGLWRDGGQGRTPAVPSHPSIHGTGRRGVGDGSRVSFVLSSVYFFGRVYFLWGQAGRRAKGSFHRAATARTADWRTRQNVRRHDLHRSNVSTIKQKNCFSIARLPPTSTAPPHLPFYRFGTCLPYSSLMVTAVPAAIYYHTTPPLRRSPPPPNRYQNRHPPSPLVHPLHHACIAVTG